MGTPSATGVKGRGVPAVKQALRCCVVQVDRGREQSENSPENSTIVSAGAARYTSLGARTEIRIVLTAEELAALADDVRAFLERHAEPGF